MVNGHDVVVVNGHDVVVANDVFVCPSVLGGEIPRPGGGQTTGVPTPVTGGPGPIYPHHRLQLLKKLKKRNKL